MNTSTQLATDRQAGRQHAHHILKAAQPQPVRQWQLGGLAAVPGIHSCAAFLALQVQIDWPLHAGHRDTLPSVQLNSTTTPEKMIWIKNLVLLFMPIKGPTKPFHLNFYFRVKVSNPCKGFYPCRTLYKRVSIHARLF